MNRLSLQEAKKHPLYRYFMAFNMPLAFIGAEIKDFEVDWLSEGENIESNKSNFKKYLDYIENIEDKLNNGTGLFISGSFGIGKTTLIVMAMKKAIEHYLGFVDKNSVYDEVSLGFIHAASIPELFGFSGDSEHGERRKSNLFTSQLIAIDDLTRLPLTGSQKEKAFIENVVRVRSFNLKPTFLTSQGNKKQLEVDISKGMTELVNEYFCNVDFIGDSYRDKMSGN